MAKKEIKIGSKVMYRGSFGMGSPEEVTIESIDKCKEERDKYGDAVESIAWDMKNYGCFTLSNGHWCYGEQIDELLDEEEPEEAKNEPESEFEVRITFRSEVYIKGKTLEEIEEKWEELPLYSADALEHYADFCELVSADRVDDNSYDDVMKHFN